jgi:uroporphyrinogen-III synthase
MLLCGECSCAVTDPIVCAFESRRADDMATLIERHGGRPMVAPSMREVPIADNPQAIQCVQQAIAGAFDIFILLTGVGTEALFNVARSQGQLPALLSAMSELKIVIRGPKPAAALKNAGLKYHVKAPEPNTWRELIVALDGSEIELSGASVAVQEYGISNPELTAALQERGAQVTTVPVYRWTLPKDLVPLQSAIRSTVDGAVDVLLFTSANQVTNVMAVAEQLGCGEALRQRAKECLTASIGPTCSAALNREGFPVHFEASPPKMGPLVRGAISSWRQRLS